jgi:hypothetical protein
MNRWMHVEKSAYTSAKHNCTTRYIVIYDAAAFTAFKRRLYKQSSKGWNTTIMWVATCLWNKTVFEGSHCIPHKMTRSSIATATFYDTVRQSDPAMKHIPLLDVLSISFPSNNSTTTINHDCRIIKNLQGSSQPSLTIGYLPFSWGSGSESRPWHRQKDDARLRFEIVQDLPPRICPRLWEPIICLGKWSTNAVFSTSIYICQFTTGVT